jgi:hypothetical protein
MRPSLSASLVLAAWLGAAPAAFAQTPPVPAPSSPALGASAHAQCRAQIDSRSLTGPERKAAMRDCMRPQRDACREQAIARGLAKGPDRKSFMHQCLHGTLAQGQ